MHLLKYLKNGIIQKGLMLCVLILLMSGCSNLGAQISEQIGTLASALPPSPTMPGSIVTSNWSYELDGTLTNYQGEWIHIPANEAGELLLWIEHAEAICH